MYISVHILHEPTIVVECEFSNYYDAGTKLEKVFLNSISDTYILISAAVRGIPLPKSPNESFHVSHDASLIFESWMPTERSVTEYPYTAISIIFIFHFQLSNKGGNY